MAVMHCDQPDRRNRRGVVVAGLEHTTEDRDAVEEEPELGGDPRRCDGDRDHRDAHAYAVSAHTRRPRPVARTRDGEHQRDHDPDPCDGVDRTGVEIGLVDDTRPEHRQAENETSDRGAAERCSLAAVEKEEQDGDRHQRGREVREHEHTAQPARQAGAGNQEVDQTFARPGFGIQSDSER